MRDLRYQAISGGVSLVAYALAAWLIDRVGNTGFWNTLGLLLLARLFFALIEQVARWVSRRITRKTG